MNIGQCFVDLFKRLEQVEMVVARQSVRINNMLREGEVTSVDVAKGTAIVEAHGIQTKPLPWMQQAGAINEWTPLSIGQRVTVISPSGDLGRAFIVPGGFTDETPQPHDKLAEKRTKIGACVVTQSGEGFVIEVGGTTFTFSADGYKQTGGKMQHDDKNVGKTHKHIDVASGSEKSGLPTPPE